VLLVSVTEPVYFTAFKDLALSRAPSGVLTLRFHTDGGPATFTGQMHTAFPRALYEIGEDRDHRGRVLTAYRGWQRLPPRPGRGTGDEFHTWTVEGSAQSQPRRGQHVSAP
jgi:hypothetical protein